MIRKENIQNYFLLFDLKEEFQIDKAQLKTVFFEKVKQYHPDFYANNPEEMTQAIEMTSVLNKAYKILNNDFERANYIINLNSDETLNDLQLSNLFLMEMMEINEEIDELSSDDIEHKEKIKSKINEMKEEIWLDLVTFLNERNFQLAKEKLLQHKYFNRLTERIDTL